jgi:putative ABC transport system ATP-binding protein
MLQGVPPLQMEEVRFAYGGRSSFSITVPEFKLNTGETVLLSGASGSGKSTVLGLICGILEAESGRILIDGTNLAELRPSARDKLRAEKCGVIFQQFNLLPYARVRDNILLPLRFAPSRRRSAGDPETEAARLCRALKLPEDVLNRKAGELSTGQQQRVAVARALIGRPPLIIADEPVSALDTDARDAFLELLFEQVEAAGSSLLMVSHDTSPALMFKRTVELEDITSKHGKTL